MNYEYMGPNPDRHEQPQQSASGRQNTPPQMKPNDDDGERAQPARPAAFQSHPEGLQEEPVFREHVTGPLPAFPLAPPPYYPSVPQSAQAQQPSAQQQAQGQPPYGQQHYGTQGYNNYPPQNGYYGGYQQYQGYQQQPYGYNGMPYPSYPGYPAYPGYSASYGYPGYPYYGYPYPMHPTRPKRDGYLFVISILSVIGSSLASLAGLGSIFVLLLLSFVPADRLQGQNQGQLFGGIVLFAALALAGGLGGTFGLFHSIRSLLRKPSSQLKLPSFWIFLGLYIVVIVIAAVLRANGQAVANLPLAIFLIVLAGILPAITILSLVVRRLHFPKGFKWPTRWRRFALAIASGALFATTLALILETILSAAAVRIIGVGPGISIDDPNQPIPSDPRVIGFIFVLVSVIAPLVEEAVKPLAIVALIGRIESAAEAFVLGLSCGIGFDLIETTGYISTGYQNWLDVALQRSTAGLLHGLGAAMVALGWYYLTHPKESQHRFLLAIGCWAYAVLQHAIWNGSFGLQLLPAPIGPYLANGVIGSGAFAFPSFLLVYVVESALMLVFLFFVTGRIRRRQSVTPPSPQGEPKAQPVQGLQRAGARA